MIKKNKKDSSELNYEDTLPLSWARMKTPVKESTSIRMNEAAFSILQAVMACDDAPALDHPDELSSVEQEVLRIDTKLTLLIELVGDLLAHTGLTAQKTKVTIGSQKISWLTDDPPAPGGRICISLCLIPGVPKPVDLMAEAVLIEPDRKGYRVEADLVGLSPSVTDLLEKIIFRHHRRIVARARRYRSSD